MKKHLDGQVWTSKSWIFSDGQIGRSKSASIDNDMDGQTLEAWGQQCCSHVVKYCHLIVVVPFCENGAFFVTPTNLSRKMLEFASKENLIMSRRMIDITQR